MEASCAVGRPVEARQVSSSGGSARSASTAAAVERLVHDVLRSLADPIFAVGSEEAGLGTAVGAVFLSEPEHNLVEENGEFRVATDRKRRLEVVPRNFRRLARLFAALDVVHRLNVASRTATQRELFYRVVAEGGGRLFPSQRVMDKAVQDVVGALRIGRPHLGVLTAEKGLIAGDILFRESSSSPTSMVALSASGTAISEAMLTGDSCIQAGPTARCVLVVEKDSFFQYLLHSRLMAALPLILVTGRGYPDMLTRRFLQGLHRVAPALPQVYLGDFDPDGVAIYLLYRACCPQLQWLGLHSEDVKEMPLRASLPLTSRDKALQRSLLRRPEVQSDEHLAEQIKFMTCKFELEALHAVYSDEGIIREFIPGKILQRVLR
eukprot:TRINITY_DN64419_c0_g1_i1.p1 TRINITY_DN64419_c0_g1~~TRINITY_DN64419_c0_g1_i1.p1  ORF type:complete len:379 (+),score=79.76 TRINITY_DN64419_c0_g1_i1:41-1177(+)